MNEYETQANKFLKKTGTEFKAEFLKYGKHFEDDKDSRDIYKITLTRGRRSYSFNFGQSVNASMQWIANTTYAKKLAKGRRLMGENKREMLRSIGEMFGAGVIENDFLRNKNYSEPTAYSVLACLQKYDVGTFENFCNEFGYDTDSKKAERIYNAVKEEYQNVAMLFNESEMNELQEIQ